jgi:two-component sensor histidine kinase
MDVPNCGPSIDSAMPLSASLERITALSLRLPKQARYAITLGLVGLAFGFRLSLGEVGTTGMPFLFFFPAILASACAFSNGSGYIAAVASAALSTYFLPPLGWNMPRHHDAISIALYAGTGCLVAMTVETLHNALRHKRAALAELESAHSHLAEAMHGRKLLLDEFRHRSRNDLQSLSALLLLRARGAPASAREALKEGAGHALSLARVHTRIAEASAGGNAAVIDTRQFLEGLCKDLVAGAAGDGLRPVSIVLHAETHPLSTERAVQLGLVLNECVTNALKYAFPNEAAGRVQIHFGGDGETFRLSVEDNGIGFQQANGEPAVPGLGTRLLRALAAQLRGTFTRETCADGGTCCDLTFPVAEPASG